MSTLGGKKKPSKSEQLSNSNRKGRKEKFPICFLLEKNVTLSYSTAIDAFITTKENEEGV